MSLKKFICIIMSFKIKRHNITRLISWCHVAPSGYETHKYGSPRTYQIRRLPAEGAAADLQFQIARPEPQRISNDEYSLAGVSYQT
jgi:hypothetical protein